MYLTYEYKDNERNCSKSHSLENGQMFCVKKRAVIFY